MPKQKIRTVFWSNQSLKNCPYFCYDLFEKEIRRQKNECSYF